jgi:3-dehydroquinate dehydratase type I
MEICVPVIDTKINNFLENLNLAQNTDGVDLVELRCDYLENFDFKNLEIIKKNLVKSAIFSFAKIKQGGKYEDSVEKWVRIMNIALTIGFEYVEIDFPDAGLLDLTKKHPQTKIIYSYNNFNQTPGYRDLRKIQKRMRNIEAIQKFTCQIKTNKDIENLIRLVVSRKKKDKMIIVPTGKGSKKNKLILPLLGSVINFVTLSNITNKEELNLNEYQQWQKQLSSMD